MGWLSHAMAARSSVPDGYLRVRRRPLLARAARRMAQMPPALPFDPTASTRGFFEALRMTKTDAPALAGQEADHG